MARDMGWKEPYEQSMALCKYVGLRDATGLDGLERGHITFSKVEEYWHRTFNCVAKRLGFNKATRRILWDDLVMGNWERLHQTDEERHMTSDEWLDKLYWDVFYCSDRWSLDRLTRCHWMYRQYEWAIKDGK